MALRRRVPASARLDREPARKFRLQSVPLAADAAADDGPKWQQVALEGDYQGYAGGELPFKFTKETFASIVANFRAHPSYKAGADGKGSTDVIAWDFHHASEYEATSGDIPVQGAPAQGWIQELEVRSGAAGAELWALTRWLEPAKSYIKAGQYKWASVAVSLSAVDPKTAKPIGPLLTSVALTNQPFIEGMLELVASRPGAAADDRVRAEYYAYAANDMSEARREIRRCLGLPLATTEDELKAELVKLAALVESGDTDAVDVAKVIGNLRTILGLPVLTVPPMVIAEALKLFEPGDDQAPHDPTAPAAPAATLAARAAQENPMDLTKLLKTLATKLGVRETEDAVSNAVGTLLELREAFIVALGLSRDVSDQRLTERAKELANVAAQRKALESAVAKIASSKLTADKVKLDGEAAGLTEQLAALFRAGGVENPDGAVAKIVDTMKAASTLEQVMPELKTLQDKDAERTKEEEEADVAAACRTYFGGAEEQKEVLALFHRAKGRKAFLEKYPAPGEGTEGLTQLVAVSGSGAPRTLDRAAPPPAGGPAPRRERADVVDLSMYPGANDTERAVAAYRATVSGADRLDFDTVFERACEAKRLGKFVNLSAGR